MVLRQVLHGKPTAKRVTGKDMRAMSDADRSKRGEQHPCDMHDYFELMSDADADQMVAESYTPGSPWNGKWALWALQVWPDMPNNVRERCLELLATRPALERWAKLKGVI